MLGFQHRLLNHFARGASDVEGPHGQLRARLADRLRGNHSNRLSLFNQSTSRQIAPVERRQTPRGD